jgi:hypothetical protein
VPFKSQAQRRKFAELLVEGKIKPETFEEWNRETGSAHLPERVRSGARKKTTGKRKRKRAKQSAKTKAKRPARPKSAAKAGRTRKAAKR